MARYHKALVPLTMAGLVALADVVGIAPELMRRMLTGRSVKQRALPGMLL